MRVKTLRKTNLVPSRYIKREKVSLPIDARGSKTPLLKLPNSKGGGGGGDFWDFLVWLCRPVLQILASKKLCHHFFD